MTRYCFDLDGDMETKFRNKVFKRTALTKGSIQKELVKAVEYYLAAPDDAPQVKEPVRG